MRNVLGYNPLRGASILLLVSAGLFGLFAYVFGGLVEKPLDLPIELDEGRETTGSFTAQWAVNFTINLDTRRKLELREQNCLLGIERMFPERCSDNSPEIVLSWRVESNGETVASGRTGDSSAGYWGPTTGKIIGGFLARPATSYRVIVTVERSSPRLQKTEPRLQVTVAPADLKWTYVWKGLLILGGFGCLLFAVTLALIALTRSRSPD